MAEKLALVRPPKGLATRFEKGHKKSRGRPKGVPNKATVEVREAAQKIVQDPEYLKSLTERLLAGRAPHIESLLWLFAYGRPKEQPSTEGTLTVRWLRPGEEED